MEDSENRITRNDVLTVFEGRAPPGEPLTASEVATAVDGNLQTVSDKLGELADDGHLQRKTVGGNEQVWWQPTAPASAPRLSDAASPLELASEPMRELELESDLVAETIGSVAGMEFYTEAEGIVSLGEDRYLEYWMVRGVDPGTYFEALESFPTVRDVRLLSTTGEEFRIEVTVTADSLMSVFSSFDGRLAYATIDADGLRMVGRFPITSTVSEVLEAAQKPVPDLRLVSQRLVNTPRLFRDLVEADLTDRQLAALKVAYFGGYFNTPRNSTGDELAGRLGITRQTFHHHLRLAEARLCRNLFEGVEHEDRSDQ